MKTVVIIPARLESTRLPRKMLLAETGKTLIEHTYDAVTQALYDCVGFSDWVVAVATDSKEIADAVTEFGGTAIMTGQHPNGTSRIAEALRVGKVPPEYRRVVNVQGDEPEVTGELLWPILNDNSVNADVITLASPIASIDEFISPSVVKVVFNHIGHAMYFSRSPIPWCDDVVTAASYHRIIGATTSSTYGHRHIGIYGYARDFLESLEHAPDLGFDVYAARERLEQLAWLSRGAKIAVKFVEHRSRGIDTREGYDAFCARYLSRVDAKPA